VFPPLQLFTPHWSTATPRLSTRGRKSPGDLRDASRKRMKRKEFRTSGFRALFPSKSDSVRFDEMSLY
jgi:hypothetical protein